MSSLLVAVINTKLCVHYRAGCVAATLTALLIARVCCCHPHSITHIITGLGYKKNSDQEVF